VVTNKPWCKAGIAKLIPALVFSILLVLPGGCGGRSSSTPANCNLTGINVFPAAATADHVAAAPGNQQSFTGFAVMPAGCVQLLANLTNITWTVSDPVNVSISNTPGITYGVATCTGTTAGAVTVTATAPNGGGATATGKATLTCK
jgi:hypothetical protein